MSGEIETIIAGRYRLTSRIGKGGMGSVFRAQHLTLGSEVAVKLIDPAVAGNPAIRARFVREAKAAAQLRSPHVVQILDYGVDGETPFIAMELLEGESLAARLERVGRLSPPDTARIVTEVARALSKAHEAGIVHRDLKPDNIFLVENEDSEVSKVLDFGVAKERYCTEEAHMTSTGAVLGTPYYMSPEQAEGLKTLDHRTDIWALAVITYECIVGARPFEAETLGALFLSICTRPLPIPSRVASVPDGFDAWFARGTSRELGDRFASAQEAAQSLQRLCEPGIRPSATPIAQGASTNAPLESAAAATAKLALSTLGAGSNSLSLPIRRAGSRGLVLWAGGLAVVGGGLTVFTALFRENGADQRSSSAGSQSTFDASRLPTQARAPTAVHVTPEPGPAEERGVSAEEPPVSAEQSAASKEEPQGAPLRAKPTLRRRPHEPAPSASPPLPGVRPPDATESLALPSASTESRKVNRGF